MQFEILGEISAIETFATGSGIRELARLGGSTAAVAGATQGVRSDSAIDGAVHLAEIHWYEAAGIGRKEFKIKHLL